MPGTHSLPSPSATSLGRLREDGFAPPVPGRPLLFVFLLIFVWSLLVAPVSRSQTPDQLQVQGYVSDFAGALSPSAREQLTALCSEVQQKTQAQIAVVTIKSLQGQSIEDYSIALATRLGIGPKSSNRGVLLLFAIDDHQYRIEVGYGLEPVLPDGKVGGIGREAVPYLRAGNYDGAVLLMTRRVADVIAADRGVTLTGSAPPPPASEDQGRSLTTGQIFLLFFVIFIVYSIIRRANRGGPNRFGGGGGWWIPPVVGGGWGGGGFGGGGGGGSGGFGGFGGGSFGGGGASGSW
jgi:uncharacterized protein